MSESRNNRTMDKRQRRSDDKVDARKEGRDLKQAEEEALLRDVKELLQMPQFKRVMSAIIAEAGLFRSPMTGNSATYHLIGKQDYGKWIFAFLSKADRELAFDLLKPKKAE